MKYTAWFKASKKTKVNKYTNTKHLAQCRVLLIINNLFQDQYQVRILSNPDCVLLTHFL